MRKLFNTRPSVATVLSLIALFAALGGTSYAAATISGKQVKNGTLTGADIKNNSVGGADVKESKLGQVPSAAKALAGRQGDQADKADQGRRRRRGPPRPRRPTARSRPTRPLTGAIRPPRPDRSVGPDGVDSAAIKPGAVDLPDIGSVTTAPERGHDRRPAPAPATVSDRARRASAAERRQLLDRRAAEQRHRGPAAHGRTAVRGSNTDRRRGYNNTGDNDAKLVVLRDQ